MTRQGNKSTLVMFENIVQQRCEPAIQLRVGFAFRRRPELIVHRHRGLKGEIREGGHEGGFRAAAIAGVDAVGFAEELDQMRQSLLAHGLSVKK